jgi:hypothetical protein
MAKQEEWIGYGEYNGGGSDYGMEVLPWNSRRVMAESLEEGYRCKYCKVTLNNKTNWSCVKEECWMQALLFDGGNWRTYIRENLDPGYLVDLDSPGLAG